MRIVIACGGSGGNLVPGLSLASQLKAMRKDTEIFFVTSRKPIDRKLLKKEKHVLMLPMIGMPPLVSWRFPLFLIRFFLSFVICLFKIAQIRPDVCVGFGGYVSGPVILTGTLYRKPTLIHEENIVPGRANRWLSRWATRIGVAFDETRKCFQNPSAVVCVGNPLREDLAHLSRAEACRYFGMEQDRFTLFVTGGSQGAHRLNCAVLEAFERMPEAERLSFQVIHSSGEKDAAWVEERYQTLGILARVYPFLEAMGEAYSAADLVIARGGAMTLAEVGHFQKPALFIPLSLAGNHQLENVKYLAERGGCLFFDEEKAMTDSFFQEMLRLKKDSSRREALSRELKSFFPNGTATRLAQEVMHLAGEQLIQEPKKDSIR